MSIRAWAQVDLTYSVAKFLVEQARGNTHAPASPQEENGLLIYNYQTTFTGKVNVLDDTLSSAICCPARGDCVPLQLLPRMHCMAGLAEYVTLSPFNEDF